MNKIFFSLKRAHHATLRFARLMLTDKGLTPARYDLLHALRLQRGGYGMGQRRLHRILGVCRATVSRMLGSLEKLGLVRRERDPIDRRCKQVWITEEGFARLQAAYDPIVRRGWVQSALTFVLGTCGHFEWRAPKHAREELRELRGHLGSLRRGFSDTASLGYPR